MSATKPTASWPTWVSNLAATAPFLVAISQRSWSVKGEPNQPWLSASAHWSSRSMFIEPDAVQSVPMAIVTPAFFITVTCAVLP